MRLVGLATPVDYLALRQEGTTIAQRGTSCASASDAAACAQRIASANAEGWPTRPDSGMPAPRAYLVAERAGIVEAIGGSTIATFLAPIDTPSDAAFLAEIATRGADCTKPSARRVEGGFEVITKTIQTCGGQQSEQRVFVAIDGTTIVRETRIVATGEDIVCP